MTLIKNNTVHLIPLASGVIGAYKTVEAEITQKELERYSDKITINGKITKPVKKEEVKAEETKQGIINIHTVDNYLGKNTRGIMNDLEEDSKHLTKEDLDLLHRYELSHKNRQTVLEKIKTMRGE